MALYSRTGRDSLVMRMTHNVEVLKNKHKRRETTQLHAHAAARHEQVREREGGS